MIQIVTLIVQSYIVFGVIIGAIVAAFHLVAVLWNVVAHRKNDKGQWTDFLFGLTETVLSSVICGIAWPFVRKLMFVSCVKTLLSTRMRLSTTIYPLPIPEPEPAPAPPDPPPGPPDTTPPDLEGDITAETTGERSV